MAKRDNEKDSERPHYYSQFWLDVAAGRRVIGTPKPNEESEPTEAELLEPLPQRKAGYVSNEYESTIISRAAANGRTEEVVQPEVESEIAPEASSDEEYTEPEEDLDLAFADTETTDDQDLPVEDTDIPDMDLSPIDGEEEYFDEENETNETNETDEDEEISWGRGRKKPKPSRQIKPPGKKSSKRDLRRGGY